MEFTDLKLGSEIAYDNQYADFDGMFPNVHYDKTLQEDFEQDRQWLAEEWERCKQESAEANGSDTQSCPELGCIDDQREDEDSLRFSTTVNSDEHTETDHSTESVGDFTIDHDDVSAPSEDQNENIFVNFPYEQQDYYRYENNVTTDENDLDHLDVIGKPQTWFATNSGFRGESDQVDIRSCFSEEQSESNCDKNREDCADKSLIAYDCTDDHEGTSDCSSDELTDEVNSSYRDDEPVNDCLDSGSEEDENDVEILNISSLDEEQIKSNGSSSANKYCTKSFQVVVISKELKNYEEVRLREKEPSDYVEVSLCKEEPTNQSKPKQIDTQDNNINHQTTQTCGILFRDKEKSPADMFICEFCHKIFANQYKLDSHCYRSHGSRRESEERDVARAKTKSKASDDWPPNIQKLARRINGKKLFFCSHCSYSVDRCDSITKHMFRIHSNGRPVPQFQCEVCGKMFVDRAYLRNHKVSHVKEKLHSCEVCGRAFHRQPSLKRHLQTHTDDRQYACTLCDYQTNRKHMMYKHVDHHKLGRAYVCHLCHSHLYTQLAYRSHMYEHRVPSNSCSFCKVGFSSKERMMSHMRKAHSAYEISVYKNKPKEEPFV